MVSVVAVATNTVAIATNWPILVSMKDTTDSIVALRSAVQQFVRNFGLLTPTQTPCGQRLSISEAHALMALLQCQQRSEQPLLKDLSLLLGIDKSNVSRLCRDLEEQGWLDIVPCPVDGRARRLKLTPLGRKKASTVDAASRRRFEAIVQALPGHSAQSTTAALQTLNLAIGECHLVEASSTK